jgi:hypothetical protein
MENVLKLQEKVIENARLPLNLVSDTVWEELGRLREQVKELCRKSSGEDKGTLRQPLLIIGDAFNSSEECPSSSELSNFQKQAPNIPVLWIQRRPRGGRADSSGIPNLPSSAPGSTAATTIGPSTGTETGEGEGDFIRATSFTS